MRRYLVKRLKPTGSMTYTIGNYSLELKKSQKEWPGVEEVIAVRIASDYPKEFKVTPEEAIKPKPEKETHSVSAEEEN